MFNDREIGRLVRNQAGINARFEIYAQQQVQFNTQVIEQISLLREQVEVLSKTVLQQAEVILLLKQQTQGASASSTEAANEPAPKVISDELRKTWKEYFEGYFNELSQKIAAHKTNEKVDENKFLSLQKQVFEFNKLFSQFDIIDDVIIEQKERELKLQLKPLFKRYIEECISGYIKRVEELDVNTDAEVFERLEGRHSHIQDQADFFLQSYGEIAVDLSAFNAAYEAFSEKKGYINPSEIDQKSEAKSSNKKEKPKSKNYTPQITRLLQAITVAGCLSGLANTSLRYMYGSERVPIYARVVAAVIIVGAVCFAALSGKEEAKNR